MKYEAKTIEEYLSKIPEERKPAMKKLWETIRENIPEGFTEELNYGSRKIILNIQMRNWIWGKVVFGLKKLTRFLMS